MIFGKRRMIWWLIPAAYIAVGCWLVPRFTRTDYAAHQARWHSIQTKEQSLREAAASAWGKSLIWPVFLVIHIAVDAITAEERAAEAEAERTKSVEEARSIIARYEAEERSKWANQFGGRQ